MTRRRWLRRLAAACSLWCAFGAALTPSVSAEPGESSSFVVAAMRVQPERWNKAHNLQLLSKFAREAARRGAQLVVTCEGFLDGYAGNPKLAPETTLEKYQQICEPLDGPALQQVAELAKELKIHLAVGFAELRGDESYNSVAVFAPDGDLALHYSKTHVHGEPFNSPGKGLPVALTDIGTVGALICYDRRFPEVPRILALKGAEILLIPAYGTDGERNEALLRTRAWENSVWVVYVKQNQALIIDPRGKIVARDRGDRDQLVFAKITIDDQVGAGDIEHRRAPSFYREIIDLTSESD